MISPSLLSILAQSAQGTGPNAAQSGNHDLLIIWAVALMGLAITLFLIEVFLPTGGIVGFLSVAAAIASIVLFFWFNTTVGLIALLLTLVATPFLLMYSIKIAPHTPLFRMLVLDHDEAVEPPMEEQPTQGVTVGATGTAVTDLRPVGACLIDGHKADCLAVGPQIERGQHVEVIGRSGPQWRVRVRDKA